MVTCPRCQKTHEAGTLFCAGCGTRLMVMSDDPSAAIVSALEAVNGGLRNVLGRIEGLERDALAGRRIQTMAGDGRRLDDGGFASLGEFVAAVRLAPHDSRLAALSPMDSRALATLPGSAGGFLVPPQFSTELMALATVNAIVRPRATVIGGGEASDAEISLPVLDTSGTHGSLGGVVVGWVGEGGLKPDTSPAFGQVTLKPSEVAAMCTLSDRLIRNAPAATTIVSTLLAEAIRQAEDLAFIQGNGVAKPLGFVGHASSIEIARAGAGHVAFADLCAMLEAAEAGRPYVWLASRTCLTDLMNLTLTGGVGGTAQPIWLPSAREGVPSTLLGLPMLEPPAQPTLGNLGDLMLVDLSRYLIRDGTTMELRTSDSHDQNFSHNLTSVRCSWCVDGQPWVTTPLLRPDGTHCSPFVILN